MAEKLWGGRFTKKIDKDFFEFQKSIQYDYKLAEYDISHSMIHVLALQNAKILTGNEPKRLTTALLSIYKDIKNNKFKPNLKSEDIHTEIQNRLEKKVGKLALKLQTLRSRNDQIVFDEKYYCYMEAKSIEKFLDGTLSSLNSFSSRYKNFHIIGYTHTQRAQKILLKDYLDAFVSMFTRDKQRLLSFRKNLTLYIGSGAFKGTSLTKEYDKAIKKFLRLFGKVIKNVKCVENSPDNVSDRDFIIEFLGILSIVQMHLSRLAEDLVLYSTKEFNFIKLPEEFCTGSSLMPHKKNPDFLELVRGYTGRIYGNLMSILTTMKGLPLTYNRDMQLDKEPLFSSVEIIEDELKIMAKFIQGIKLNTRVIEEALKDRTLYATELAEWLVKRQAVSFKQAHDIVGKVIILSEKNGGVEKISDEDLKDLHWALNKDLVKKIMNVKYARIQIQKQ